MKKIKIVKICFFFAYTAICDLRLMLLNQLKLKNPVFKLIEKKCNLIDKLNKSSEMPFCLFAHELVTDQCNFKIDISTIFLN